MKTLEGRRSSNAGASGIAADFDGDYVTVPMKGLNEFFIPIPKEHGSHLPVRLRTAPRSHWPLSAVQLAGSGPRRRNHQTHECYGRSRRPTASHARGERNLSPVTLGSFGSI